MKDRVLLIKKKMKLFFLFLAIFSLLFPDFLNAQSTVFESQSQLQSGSSFSSPFYSPFQAEGTFYSPFESSDKNPLSGSILYGPGGEPIGGLPIYEGYWIVCSFAVLYAIYIKRRKIVANKK